MLMEFAFHLKHEPRDTLAAAAARRYRAQLMQTDIFNLKENLHDVNSLGKINL